jgi:cell division septal protein FtsQ
MSEEPTREEEREEVHLDWKDYIAFAIALLQTVLLPYVLFIVALLIILAIFLLLV